MRGQQVSKAWNFSALIISALVLNACATSADSTSITTQPVQQVQALQSVPAQDRQAILAMVGNYKVTFDFTETVSFQKGYELKEPYETGGDEIVRVIKNEPGFISLQHILVVGGEDKIPVKHWRQDWIYEPAYIYDFVGFNSWRKRELSPDEREGKWAQVVYQVDDSPRYAAIAEWKHENGYASWTSPLNMRPLPRRDMTKRDDYHGMLAVNRHALTPDGWVHEQDNTKLILTGDVPRALVREVGINTYLKSDDFEVSVADDYWAATKGYWAGVRDIWTEMENTETAFGLTIQGEPTDLYTPLLEYADAVIQEEISEMDAINKAKVTIEKFTTTDIDTSIAKAKAEADADALVQSDY